MKKREKKRGMVVVDSPDDPIKNITPANKQGKTMVKEDSPDDVTITKKKG